jgi:hypothetical protein
MLSVWMIGFSTLRRILSGALDDEATMERIDTDNVSLKFLNIRRVAQIVMSIYGQGWGVWVHKATIPLGKPFDEARC